MTSLSKGAILHNICKGDLPDYCNLQVIATRKINAPQGSQDKIKYRISLSDGEKRFSQAVLLLEQKASPPEDDAIIKISGKSSLNSLKSKQISSKFLT